MARLAHDLKAVETDEEPSPKRRAEIIAWVNERRLRAGTPPLADEWVDSPKTDYPKEEFYRRARTLGMVSAPRRRR